MNVKVLIGFISGAIFGGALGAYLMKDKYKEESEQAIEAIRLYYKEKSEKKRSEKEEEHKEVKHDDDAIADLRKVNTYTDYSTKKYAEEVKKYTDIPPAEAPSEPYVITEDEYTDTNPHYTKTDLYYYSMNDVLTDIDDDVITDPESLVGKNLYKRFQSQGGFDSFIDEIFMRNDNISEDFHITHEVGKFITGLEEG